MQSTNRLTLPAFFAETVSKYKDRNAMALIGEKPISYGELETRIRALIAFLEKLGFERGDKAAILSSNLPNWGIAYYAVTFMKATVVPILPDFHINEIETILAHSDTKILFISTNILAKMPGLKTSESLIILNIEDFSVFSRNDNDVAYDPAAKPAKEYFVGEEDLAAIIYTSGTTGKSKGVMLTHRNICFTAEKSGRVQEITENDRFLSILPLSHTYENTIGLILPMSRGACIFYLGKPPSPAILMPALQEVKPTLILTVPLIIEKIFRTRIQPKFSGNILLRLAIHVPFIRKKLNVVAGKKLMESFGGQLHFFGIGGAKLNRTVEKFLIEAKFPYAIGYGLTESSPLIAGCSPRNSRLQSTGPAIEDIELKIHNPNKKTGEGEIWARGPNVMKGYYKEPGLTEEILTSDGWLRTGDLGKLDRDGYLYIKGRLKNMIVRSGGENIYPEEIESIINNFRHVVDSLVIEQKGKLVALVHFNRQEIEETYHAMRQDILDYAEEKIEELRVELQHYVNHRVNKFSQVQLIVVQPEPFEKTATQKIKRYLYG
jgi:long-chain acyl-CoA synthetase